MTGLFSSASPRLLTEWTLAPQKRKIHDPDREDKITYTARLILVLEGEVLFCAAARQIPAKPGTLLYLPPACVYDSDFLTENFASQNLFFSFSEDRPEWEFFTEAFLRNIPGAGTEDRRLLEEPPAFSDAPELAGPLAVEADEETKALLEGILRESRRPDPLSPGLIGARLTEILVRMLRQNRGERAPQVSAAYRRISEYVEEHIGERLSGEELRDALNYHPYYMNRVVSRYAGVSLHEFILRAKLRRAKTLLAETDTPLSEIAHALAFCDASHFSRVFAAREGVSPRIFRASARRL